MSQITINSVTNDTFKFNCQTIDSANNPVTYDNILTVNFTKQIVLQRKIDGISILDKADIESAYDLIENHYQLCESGIPEIADFSDDDILTDIIASNYCTSASIY